MEVDEEITIKSEEFRSYSKLKLMFKGQHTTVAPPPLEKAHKLLPGVHSLIVSVERLIDGILHHEDLVRIPETFQFRHRS